MNCRSVVIIPARFASTRLPGKPLINLFNKPMIRWVYEQALQIPRVERVLVATDDQRILDTVTSFGGEAYLTPVEITTGSERVGFLVQDIDADIVINLQGDEPLISPKAIGKALKIMEKDDQISVATLGFPVRSEEEWRDPAVVKVIVDHHMQAIYFSRAPIPHPRQEKFQPVPLLYRHIGVYLYRKDFLLDFLKWPEGVLEKIEKLEQLRILERGYRIKVVEADTFSAGVDTAKDARYVESRLKERGMN